MKTKSIQSTLGILCILFAMLMHPVVSKAAIGTPTVTSTPVSCSGGSNGTATASVNGGSGSSAYTYSWSNGTSGYGAKATTFTVTVSNLAAGTYTVHINQGVAASVTASVLVGTNPALSSAGAAVVSNACNSLSNGSATSTPVGGGTPYTYAWSNGTSTVSTSSSTGAILAPGTYTVTVNDICGDPAVTGTVTINQSPPIIPTASVTTSILCHGGTGSATAGATGGVSPYTYSWSSGGGTNATISSYSVVATSTTYSIIGITASLTVPAGVTQVSITVDGGAGGKGDGSGEAGGDGAGFTGIATVTTGHVLGIITGGVGTNGGGTGTNCSACTDGGGGGGGSYVWDESTTNLPIAVGAGGGGGGFSTTGSAGGTNLTTNATTTGTGAGGIGGNGGAAGATGTLSYESGGGGAGWLSNGGSTSTNGGGDDMANGFGSGAGYPDDDMPNGGWGGGGGGGANGGGGGGGYNGGGGSGGSSPYNGGGGGSYFNTAYGSLLSITGVTKTHTGNGLVTIAYPASSGSSGVPAGTYTITVTDANGCSATASVVLSQPNLLTTAASVIANSCYTPNTGNASATPGGGTSPYTYAWSTGTTTNVVSTSSSTGAILSGGTYTVNVTDANGCGASASVAITQSASPVTAAATVINACAGNNNGIATATPTGSTTPYTYSWSTGDLTSSISNLSAGIYTLTVWAPCGNPSSIPVTVNQSSIITATTSVVTPITCYGATNGSATVGVSGGATPYTYSWSGGGTNATINTYTISGDTTYAIVGAVQTFTVPAGIIQLSVTVTGAGGGIGGGGVSTDYTGGKGAGFKGTIKVTPGDVLGVVMGGTGGPGNTGGDGGGGGGGGTYVWDENTTTLLAVAGGGGGADFGNGSNNVSGGAGGTNLTTNLSINGGAGGSNASGGTGGNGGTVVNTGYDGAGGAGWLTNGASVTLTPTAGGGSDMASGFGGGAGAAANGNGGYGGGGGGGGSAGGGGGGYNGGGGGVTGGGGGGGSYLNTVYGTLPASSITQSNTGNGSATIAYSATYTTVGVPAGTYTVTVTDANGCTQTASVTLTEPTILTTGASVLAEACPGTSTGNAMATVNGGTLPYTYLWSNGNTNNPTGATLSAANYTVTVQDACSASVSATVSISQPPTLTITASTTTNVTCNTGNDGSASSSPSGGAPPYTYSWSGGGGSNSTASGLTSGNYTVTVQDACAGSNTASVTITQPGVLTAGTSVTSNACNGSSNGSASASPSGGTTPYTYSWSNGSSTVSTNNPTGAVLSAGSYTVTVQDACSNSATAAVTINGSSAITASASVTIPVCYGETNGAAMAGVTGGASPYTYSWSSGGGTNATISSFNNSGTPTFSYNGVIQNFTVPNGVTQISVTVTGAGGGRYYSGTPTTQAGGNGAGFTGMVSVTAGQVLSVVVGGKGVQPVLGSGGGGGASWVYDSVGAISSTPHTGTPNLSALIVVAGGGGGGGLLGAGASGGTDLIGNAPTNTALNNASGGVNGSGGSSNPAKGYGAGGAGWDGNGLIGTAAGIAGGNDWANSFASASGATAGGGAGGFGGGGGGANTTSNNAGGGGGGGYNGGGGGAYVTIGAGPGGGGGSYFNTAYGSLPGSVSTTNTGNGSVAMSYSASSNTGIIAGTYTVTITDANGCNATASVSLSQPTALSLTTASVISNACYGTANGNASVSITGGTLPYTYAWSNGSTVVSISNPTGAALIAGNYTVTVKDACGASAIASVSITQPSAALSTSAEVISNACNGTNGGITLANTSGGVSPYTYSWSAGGGTNSYASGLSGGTYTVTVQDNSGCGASSTASVTIHKSNIITATAFVGNDITCYGASDGLVKVAGVTGGAVPYIYSWSTGSAIYIASNLSPGTYSVTVADQNGCSSTSSVTLTQPAPLRDSVASITYPLCSGQTGSATIGVKGGTTPYRYEWAPNVSDNTATVTGLTLTTYSLQVADNRGCRNNLTFTITQPVVLRDSIIRSAIANVSCVGNNGSAAVGVKYGTPPYTYSWSGGGGNNATASGLSVGTYTVTVSDASSCTTSVTASVTIGQSAAISATALVANAITCYGASNGLAKVATVTGGSSPYTYSWSNGSGIYIASNLSMGTYSVTVSDRTGCSLTESVTLTQPTLLRDSVASLTYPLCLGGTGIATIGVQGGTTPYRYTWAPNISNNTAIASGIIVQHTYSVQVKDQDGCSNNLTFSISQPPVLHDSIVSGYTVNTTCGQSNGSATVGVEYGIQPYTYSWSGGAGNNATASGLSSGTYTVTVNDAGSCSASISVSIAKSAALAMTPVISNAITCNGASNGLAKVATVTGGSTPYTYSWSNGSTIYIASSLSTGTYSVTVTDRTGCISTATVTLSQPATLRDSVASLSSPPCTGGGTGSVTIGVSGGSLPYRYTWAPNISSTDSAEGLTVRSYTVLARDNNGCSSYVYFSVSCSSVVEASPNTTSCCPGMDNINLYPNPNTGQFTLSGLQKDMTLEVYDYTGKKISSISATGETMQLNIFNQADGVYLVRILDKNGNLISQKKVVKTQ